MEHRWIGLPDTTVETLISDVQLREKKCLIEV